MAGTYPFIVGEKYERRDVFEMIGIADPGGGSWNTGYTFHENDAYIFCTIGESGRTGHFYENAFDCQGALKTSQ